MEQPPPPASSAAPAAPTTAAAAPAPPAAAPPGQPFRPLNVKDALSYLDRVKVTFNDQAEVYDRFLTIMKQFKSQGIDTPGVIERVSTLFRGHPALIQGFNTFLPPGYRIECSVSTPADDGAVTTITVTTPMGTTTRTQVTGAAGGPGGTPATSTTTTTGGPSSTTTGTVPGPSRSPLATNATTKPSDAAAPAKPDTTTSAAASLQLPSLPAAPTLASISGSTPAIATPGAASVLSNQLPNNAGGSGGATTTPAAAGGEGGVRAPMEFNHAINYVNKIKNRFVRDPDTYKAFLEILQTYQKEGRAIQDVYAQVTTLFHAAPDLLDEFKQFLPDTSGEAATAAGSTMLGQIPALGSSRSATTAVKRPAAGTSKREDQNSVKKAKVAKPKVDDKNKSKRSTKPEVVKDARKALPTDIGGPYLDQQSLGDPSLGYGGSASHQNQHLTPHYQSGAYPHPSSYPVAPPQQPNLPVAYAYEAPPPPPPPQPILAPKPRASSADIAFFNRVKTHTNDQPTYHEFLKLLNLYTQDILDLTALVSRAYLFIGQDANLWREFRDIVGWSEGKAVGDPGARIEVVDGVRIVENVPSLDGPRRSRGDDGKGWKTYGPSYRQLPPSEISLNCSGRDALCWDVLNDEWVSQPSWASDEGFVAHRKNPYEEAMHRSEEERHEYDYHIEANLRTIALLEPIATRIAIMEADERATFRLKPGLGNQSKSIYQRVIKKVYGKEQGGEVIQALHENPCVAVPIVLARLKQKDDEWKHALREWNRVWRESDVKNFWKSLDHQGISLKASDKRIFTNKALVTEIETLKRVQRQRASGGVRPTSAPTSQLSYDLSDREAVFDAAKLIFSFLDRTTTISNADKDKVDGFLRNFISLLFAITPMQLALELMPVGASGGAGDDDLDSVEGVSDAGTSAIDDAIESASASGAAPAGKKGAPKRGGDLRKKALKNAGGPAKKGDAGRRSKVSSPAPSSRGASPAPSAGTPDTTDAIMADAMPTVASLATLITPEVEAEIAANREQSNAIDSSREASTAALGDDMPSPSLGPQLDGGDSPVGTPEPSNAGDALPELIIPVSDTPARVDHRRQWNLFANSNLYCLVRLFQILYSRLTLLRNSAVIVAHPPPPQAITARHVPSLSLSLTMAPASQFAAKSTSSQVYYERALALAEQLFDGLIDQNVFEEGMRKMFATQGYMLFTVDKLLTAILKHSHSAMSDGKTQDLVELAVQDRAHPDRSTSSQQTFYRAQAESALGDDENLYRVEWIPSRRSLAVQLLGKDTIAAEDLAVAEREWATYLEEFVLSDPTPGVAIPSTKPFLARNLKKASPSGVNDFPSNLTVKSSLQSKICMRSYRIFFVADTEDELVRRNVKPAQFDAEGRKKRFEKWLGDKEEKLEKKTVATTTAEAEGEKEDVKMTDA